MAGKHHAPLGIQIPRTGRVRVINFQNGMLFTRCISATHWLGNGGLFCQSGGWAKQAKPLITKYDEFLVLADSADWPTNTYRTITVGPYTYCSNNGGTYFSSAAAYIYPSSGATSDGKYLWEIRAMNMNLRAACLDL
ncbi:hypothetical protein [Chromobacterium subtsugae]|uniref:hypothetical protein n=1 Tax=Chromobacterium subtsugae TaxID=251747 RepID=UPI00128E4C06|nr:hypothetical protein [Chromobacterium subtsugae]